MTYIGAIVNAFSYYFNPVFEATSSSSSDIFDKSDVLYSLCIINITHVSDKKVTAGHEGVPSFVLRDRASVFAKSSTKILNLSLNYCRLLTV